MNCRHCRHPLEITFVDLGCAPPSNRYLTADTLTAPEKWYPLRVLVCTECWLVQTEDFTDAAELFDSEYAYFSSVSASWLAHCGRYVEAIIERFGLEKASHVIEVACNDGGLLGCFQARGIQCTGIEPTASTAAAARAKGVEVIEDFFGTRLATRLRTDGRHADLIVANNVFAHVPDINDFAAGFAMVLKEEGVATFEFPHLTELIRGNQFDTIYHEHYSYLSFTAAKRILETNGLSVFDVERLPTHGGSLRVFVQRADTGSRQTAAAVAELLAEESRTGVTTRAYYEGFQQCAERVRDEFVAFLTDAKREGRRVAAYGAAAKGNTLLNFAGICPDSIPFVVDRSESKQGKFMPGSRIPIVDEDELKLTQPDYVVVLPWNLRVELIDQLAYVRDWGGRFVMAIPSLVLE